MRAPRHGPWDRDDEPATPPRAAPRRVAAVLLLALAIAVFVLVWLDRHGALQSGAAEAAHRAIPPAPPPPPPLVHSPRDDPRTALPRPAVAAENPAGWLTADDYPPGALREGQAGVTRVAAAIGADGRVTECAIVESSGYPLLDANACGLIEQRGHFWPARDAAGRARPGHFTRAVRWQIPEGR